MIKLIFASGENGEFGTPTGMPWPRHKQDMQEFKRLTKNNLVVMGNETFKTLGSKPLPERANLIFNKFCTILRYRFWQRWCNVC